MFGFYFRVYIAGNEKNVGTTIVVEVHNPGAPIDITGFNGKTGRQCAILEAPLASIDVQHIGVAPKMGLKDIQLAAESCVPNSHAHAGLLNTVFAQSGPGNQSHFLERAVTPVAEEQARAGIARNIDIRPAVLVKVGSDYRKAIAGRHL